MMHTLASQIRAREYAKYELLNYKIFHFLKDLFKIDKSTQFKIGGQLSLENGYKDSDYDLFR